MARKELRGPFELSSKVVQQEVHEMSPGAYALGESKSQFKVRQVGRADLDVALAIQSCVGAYPQFQFAYVATAKEAFELECELFHDHFADLLSYLHPSRPAGSRWQGPALPKVHVLAVKNKPRRDAAATRSGRRLLGWHDRPQQCTACGHGMGHLELSSVRLYKGAPSASCPSCGARHRVAIHLPVNPRHPVIVMIDDGAPGTMAEKESPARSGAAKHRLGGG